MPVLEQMTCRIGAAPVPSRISVKSGLPLRVGGTPLWSRRENCVRRGK
jgi:hypothetical protein